MVSEKKPNVIIIFLLYCLGVYFTPFFSLKIIALSDFLWFEYVMFSFG